MVQRREYMEKLIKLKDEKVIKVITGVRRCGKSTLLCMFQDNLLRSGVEAECCISMNFEDIRFENQKEYHRM